MSKSLRFLLDENISVGVAEHLKFKGHDVIRATERKIGATDKEVLDIAMREKRVLVTLDKDFAYLVFLNSLKHAGVILLRLRNEAPINIIATLENLLKASNHELEDKFTVATETKFRFR